MESSKKRKYLNLKEAAKVSGYAPDYIGYLIRTKKLKGKKFFTNISWQTNLNEVIKYCKKFKKNINYQSSYFAELKKKKYISLKEAAKISGYSPGYIGYLLRKGKIKGRKFYTGICWITTEKSIRKYQEKKLKNKLKIETQKKIYSDSPFYFKFPFYLKLIHFIPQSSNKVNRIFGFGWRLALVAFIIFFFVSGFTPAKFLQGSISAIFAQDTNIINFYSTNSYGFWQNSQNIQGEPEVGPLGYIDSFSESNSAVYKSGSLVVSVEDFRPLSVCDLNQKQFQFAKIKFSFAIREKTSDFQLEQSTDIDSDTDSEMDNTSTEEQTSFWNKIKNFFRRLARKTTDLVKATGVLVKKLVVKIASMVSVVKAEESGSTTTPSTIIEEIIVEETVITENPVNETTELTEPAVLEPIEQSCSDELLEPSSSQTTTETIANESTIITEPPTTESPITELPTTEETTINETLFSETITDATTTTEITTAESVLDDVFLPISEETSSQETSTEGSASTSFQDLLEEELSRGEEITTTEVTSIEDAFAESMSSKATTTDSTEATSSEITTAGAIIAGTTTTESTTTDSAATEILPELDTKIVVWYSLNGENWQKLDTISDYPLSNNSNGGYFEYDASFLKNWEDVKNLKIKFEGVVGGETNFEALLDSVWVEAYYSEKGTIDEEQGTESVSTEGPEEDISEGGGGDISAPEEGRESTSTLEALATATTTTDTEKTPVATTTEVVKEGTTTSPTSSEEQLVEQPEQQKEDENLEQEKDKEDELKKNKQEKEDKKEKDEIELLSKENNFRANENPNFRFRYNKIYFKFLKSTTATLTTSSTTTSITNSTTTPIINSSTTKSNLTSTTLIDSSIGGCDKCSQERNKGDTSSVPICTNSTTTTTLSTTTSSFNNFKPRVFGSLVDSESVSTTTGSTTTATDITSSNPTANNATVNDATGTDAVGGNTDASTSDVTENTATGNNAAGSTATGTQAGSDSWRGINVTSEVQDLQGNRVNIDSEFSFEENGEFSVILEKPSEFRPGLYKLVIKIEDNSTGLSEIQVFEQEFRWGVLAINTNKSIYLSNEQVYIQIAALKDDGHTICDADLRLEIISPTKELSSVSVERSRKCGPDNVTDVPDYFAYYQINATGTYQMKLTNLDTGYEIEDSFEVRDSVPFDVERTGPTRIYPPASYEMNFRIKANQDFKGKIIENVPVGFKITETDNSVEVADNIIDERKNIIWDVNLQAGDSYQFGYQFNAPDISPYLYLLGPLTFRESESQKTGSSKVESLEVGNNNPVFEETRQWQIASDAPDTLTLRPNASGDATNLSVNTGSNWDAVNEDPSDGDSTYVYNNTKGGTLYDLYNLQNLTDTGTINSVTVWINARDSSQKGGATAKTVIKDNNTERRGSAVSLPSTGAWTLASTTYTTDAGGGSWDWSDITNLQAGVELANPNTANIETQCTQVWAVVDYTKGTTLAQTSYRWQNDDGDSTGNPTTGGNVNNNTNSAAADTSLEMEKGERATWRVQVENSGAATTTSFKIQWATTTGVCTSSLTWQDVGATTEIAWSYGLSGTSSDSLTASICASNSNTWTNGKWLEATSTTGDFTLATSTYTEFAFMLETSNAVTGTDYCLRLINETASSTLSGGYDKYGELSIVSSATKRYSKDAVSSISDSDYNLDLTYYLDNDGYDDVAGDDGNSDAITSAADTVPVFLFAKQHTNNTDDIYVTWNGSTTIACATNKVYLQVYNINSLTWETFASSTTCTAGTDFSLSGNITTNPGNYYDSNNWRFVRLYQASSTQQTLRTDYINITSQPIVDEVHYRWRNDDGGEGIPWYDSGWSYRKSIPIQNTTGTLTDYQVKIIVASSTGQGGDVTCDGHCQDDFDDVRFTAADGQTLLDYWRESYATSASSTFWVKIPSLPANSTTTIYMYYGNASATTTSNGDNTFEFFDDFSGAYPGSKWTGDTSYGTVTNGILDYYSGSGSWQKIYSTSSSTPDMALRARAYFELTYNGLDDSLGFEASPCCNGRSILHNTGISTADDYGNSSEETGYYNYDTWYIFDIEQVSGTSVKLYVNGDLKTTKTDYVGTLPQPANIASYRDHLYVDWILIRNYTSQEPSIGTPGSEETSGGATWMAAEDSYVALTAVQQSNNIRVRFLLRNSGSSADNYNYRLQYAPLGGAPNCTSVAETNFNDVPTTTGSVVQMATSTNFTDQASTINFEGSLTDPSNGWSWKAGKMVEYPSYQTDAITLNEYEFTELEYNFKFTNSAPDGTNYCFRVAKGEGGAATSLDNYTQIARISTKADVTVTTIGSQTDSIDIPLTSSYVGGGFVIQEHTGSRNVTGITITEQGTVDAQNDLENIKLFYDLDTTFPYDCVSEQYDAGSDSQFGSTTTFNGANGTATFTDTVSISTTSTMCVYVVLDVKKSASVDETLEIQITDPSTEVTVSSGTIGPSSALPISGTTELVGIDEVHYRWRGDTAGEALANWLYKKSIGVKNSSSSDLTDFQVRVKVGYNTTSGVDVSCESHCQTDFDDIRFTNSDQTILLDHWREKYDLGTSSTFWVKIPSLPANSTTTIYMYYGNLNAGTASNGENTFIFYDDFEDRDYSDKWTAVDDNYWQEGSDVMMTVWGQGSRFIYLKNRNSSNNSPEVHEFKVKWLSGETGTHLAGMMWHWNSYSDMYRVFYYDPGSSLYTRYVDTDLGSSPISYTGSYDEWYHFLLKIKGGGNYYFQIEKNDGTNVTSTNFSDNSGTSGHIGLGGGGSGAIYAYYDDYRIRKYASPEPSVVTTGSEETGGTGWLAAEDTATTTDKNINIRLRFSLKNTGTSTQDYHYRLQYAPLGGAPNCTSVAETSFSDVPTSTAGSPVVVMATSSWFTGCPEANQASTTHQLSDISGLTWAAGKVVDDVCNQTASTTLNTNYYTEHEFNFKFTNNAADNTAYCFRLAKGENGTATSVDSYSQIAKITTSGAVPAGINISGNVYTDDGNTTTTAITTISLAVNNTKTVTTSISNGAYSFSNVSTTASDIITVYWDADGGSKAVTVTKGASSDITDLHLYQNRVIVRHEGASALTIADMAKYDSSDDTDILFTATTTSPNTLTVDADAQLYIWPGKEFAPGGNVTLSPGGSGDSWDGSLKICSNSTFTAAGTESHSIGGSWSASSTATFNPASSTVTFTATTPGKTITTGGNSFWNLTFNGAGGGWTFQDAATTSATTTITQGTLSQGSNNFVTRGLLIETNGTFIKGTGNALLIFEGAGTGYFQDNTTTNNLGNVHIGNSPAVTNLNSDFVADSLTVNSGNRFNTRGYEVDITNFITIYGTYDCTDNKEGDGTITTLGTDWTVDSGATFNAANSTTTFDGTSPSKLDSGGTGAGHNFYNLTFEKSSTATTTISTSSIKVLGNLIIGSNSILDVSANNYSINIAGNWTNSGTFEARNGTVTFDATTTGKTVNPGSSPFYDITFNGTGGGWTITANATSTNNFIITAGTVTSTSGILACGGNFDVSGGTFRNNSGKVLLNSASDGKTVTTGGTGNPFYDIEFNGNGGWTFAATDHDVDNNFTITQGTVTSTANTLYIGGSWANTGGTFNANSGAVVFDATTTGKTVNPGSSPFYDITFNGTGGGWTITANATSTNNWNLTQGASFTATSSSIIEVQGKFNTQLGGASTTWAGSTLYLNNSGSNYSINTSSTVGDIYGNLKIGANTHIRMWNSSASSYDVDSSGSLYSQDHAGNNGHLYIFGDYHTTSTDYWSYATDFDGSSGNNRQCRVTINSTTSITIDSGATLEIKGGGATSTDITIITYAPASGSWDLNNNSGSELLIQEATINYLNPAAGTITVLNTILNNEDAPDAGATLNVDWYLGAHVINKNDTFQDIGNATCTISNSTTSQATVWKHNGTDWGNASTSQVTVTLTSGSATGTIPQPGSNGAIRIREYSRNSATTTYYKYNLQISAAGFTDYDYWNDFGNQYIASVSSTESTSTVDKCISENWQRDNITVNNQESALNSPPTYGTWYAGMTADLEFGVDSINVDLGTLDASNFYTATATTILYVTTTASNGYVITAYDSAGNNGKLVTSSYEIARWPHENDSPAAWTGYCKDDNQWCGFGYTTDDTTLSGTGGLNRFATSTKYAGFDISEATAKAVADETTPVGSGSQHTITYKVSVSETQKPAAKYSTTITYICTVQY